MNQLVEPEKDNGDAEEVRPTHSEDGVDLTLIRWMLSLTPLERLLTVQQYARSIVELRRVNNLVP